MITPYENATKGDPRYMHCYEFDDLEAEITFKRMRPLHVRELFSARR